MPVFRTLLILFLTVPLLEIYILIQVGSALGAMPTVLLCIFTAVLGALLIRIQGLQTLARVQRRLEVKELPAVDLIAGLILLLTGVLLLTPGFFTDVIGFLCLIPRFREYLARRILQRMIEQQQRHPENQTIIIDGEHWSEEDTRRRLRR